MISNIFLQFLFTQQPYLKGSFRTYDSVLRRSQTRRGKKTQTNPQKKKKPRRRFTVYSGRPSYHWYIQVTEGAFRKSQHLLI